MDRKRFYRDLSSGKISNMIRESVPGNKIHDSRETFNIIKPLTAEQPDVEQGWFIFLDAKNGVIAIEKLFTGTISSSAIYPREIIKKCLKHQAVAVIMAHNHPSGDCLPSPEDFAITKILAAACSVCGITFHEHIVLGADKKYFSMADQGYIQKYFTEYNDFTQRI